jgi:hypothetical protein
MSDDGGDWGTYRRLILAEIQRVSRDIEAINQKLDRFRESDLQEIKVDIAMLKVKASAWGGLAGLIAALVMLLGGWIAKGWP